VFRHILATCLTIQNDKATKMEETKLKMVVDRTNSEYNLFNNLQWQEVEKRKKSNHKTMPSSSGVAEGTQLVNDEVNEVIYCIMDRPSNESLNFESSICQSLPQENVDPEVCMNTSVLPYPSSLATCEDCMEAEVKNIIVHNVSDDDFPKATSPSLQFSLSSSSIDNQLTSKAKDSFEDRKKKGSGGSNKKKKKSGSLHMGNLS